MSKAFEQAQKIIEAAQKNGFNLKVRGGILTASKNITPGSIEEFAQADMSVGSVLSLLPCTSPGSIWGTDGGSVGGMVAVRSGNFVMNRSGGSKLVLKALTKLVA